RRRRLCCNRRRAVCHDHGHLAANQIGGQYRQSIVVTLGPAVFDDDVLVFDGAGLRQALAEGCDETRVFPGRRAIEEPDHRQRVLLRARRERPRGRAAEQRDELAALHLRGHSITSSARASNEGGTSSPRALAVFRLIAISYLVGACTGKSAAFSPLRM